MNNEQLLPETAGERPSHDGNYGATKRCCTVCDAKKLCHVCGQATLYACSDCHIDFGVTIYVCPTKACRDAHEDKCSFQLRERLAASPVAPEVTEIKTSARPHVWHMWISPDSKSGSCVNCHVPWKPANLYTEWECPSLHSPLAKAIPSGEPVAPIEKFDFAKLRAEGGKSRPLTKQEKRERAKDQLAIARDDEPGSEVWLVEFRNDDVYPEWTEWGFEFYDKQGAESEAQELRGGKAGLAHSRSEFRAVQYVRLAAVLKQKVAEPVAPTKDDPGGRAMTYEEIEAELRNMEILANKYLDELEILRPAVAEDRREGDLSVTQKMRGRAVTHEEAKKSAHRLINSHFNNPDKARMQIPVHYADDDVTIIDYVTEQSAKLNPLSDEHMVRQIYPDAKLYGPSGDGCHIRSGDKWLAFGSCPDNAWRAAAQSLPIAQSAAPELKGQASWYCWQTGEYRDPPCGHEGCVERDCWFKRLSVEPVPSPAQTAKEPK